MLSKILKLISEPTLETRLEDFMNLSQEDKEQELLIMRRELLYEKGINFSQNSFKCGLVGVENVGKTCQINTILQCLTNTMPLSRALLQSHEWKKQINPFSKYSEGHIKIWQAQQCYICPNDLFKRLLKNKYIKSLILKQNQILFLKKFIDILHDDLNVHFYNPPIKNDPSNAVEYLKNFQQKNKSQVLDIFYGLRTEKLCCETCNNEVNKYQMFNILQLNFPKNNIFKLQGYILRICDSQKIVEFSFQVDLADSTDSILEHIFNNLGEQGDRSQKNQENQTQQTQTS